MKSIKLPKGFVIHYDPYHPSENYVSLNGEVIENIKKITLTIDPNSVPTLVLELRSPVIDVTLAEELVLDER